MSKHSLYVPGLNSGAASRFVHFPSVLVTLYIKILSYAVSIALHNLNAIESQIRPCTCI